jgi:hypothetical protein
MFEIVLVSVDTSAEHSSEDNKPKLPGSEEYCILKQTFPLPSL